MSPGPRRVADEPAPADESAVVRARWRAASLAEVWLRPEDWDHPAVDALVEAIGEGRPTVQAARRLGFARSQAGVGLHETLDDMACAFRAAGRTPSPEDVRATALGWAGGQEQVGGRPGVHDPATGLATRAYLGERLRETYGKAEAAESSATGDEAALADDGTPAGVPGTHCLLVIDVAVDGLAPWERAARAAAVGQAIEQAFGPGHPAAALSGGMFVVLCERGGTTADIARSTQRIIERQAELMDLGDMLRRPTRVWVERLPTTHVAAVELLRTLCR